MVASDVRSEAAKALPQDCRANCDDNNNELDIKGRYTNVKSYVNKSKWNVGKTGVKVINISVCSIVLFCT